MKRLAWLDLYNKLGKQPVNKMRDTNVQVKINGELKNCDLVYENAGRDFYLVLQEEEKTSN